MKKTITFLLLFLMFRITTVAAAGKLYVVGDAVFSGWDLSRIPLMYAGGSDVFTYTGWFEADKEFKFLSEPDFGSVNYKNGAGETGYLVDGAGTLVTEGDDWKFKLPESGNYTVSCDLTAMTITAEKTVYQDTHVNYAALYLVGSATAGDWSLDSATPLLWRNNNTYSAKVSFKAGTFKMTKDISRGYDNAYFLFRDMNNDGLVSADDTDDRQWTITDTGDYWVTVDLEAMAISIVKDGLSTVMSHDDFPVFNVYAAGHGKLCVEGAQGANFRLYSARGQMLYETKVNDMRQLFSTDMFKAGLYIVVLSEEAKIRSYKVILN